MDHHYEQATKRLISVLQRLEQWFRGEKLYEKAHIEPSEEVTVAFRWNYLSGHIEWLDVEQMKWCRVINAKRPDIMCQCVSIVEDLHDQARSAKHETAGMIQKAALRGETYHAELSEHADLSGPPSWRRN